MKGNEIRSRFLEYFERNGHKTVHSSPVYPPNDPTILFTNAGMNQFKDVFLGNEKREYTRAASSQKCVRAGGKHNDLDEVGKTARHLTFFEMLGNFSFGDYFKEDAINFAWDFLVNELKLDVNRLWFTIFAGDDEVPADEEAAQLWIKAGALPDRVLRFGKKDNFWQMADTGPCGPCSEINYYLGDEPENPEKNRAEFVNADTGDVTMEIWNLVFMQFNRIGEGEPQADGKYASYRLEPLPAPSVDTGMGLERFTTVLQGVDSVYETDLIKPIVEFAAQLSGKNYVYESTEGFAMRVVADHARTTAFAIADGILPGNEGRSYVLRKIMRRAIYHGREHLGFGNLFFHKVCEFVVEQMREAYPELEAQRDFIDKMVQIEEERFGNTLTVGLQKLDELLTSKFDLQTFDFKELAKLYDTYGTPRDLIRVILEEKTGIEIPEEEFNNKFEKDHRIIQLSGSASATITATTNITVTKGIYSQIAEAVGANKFHGYEMTRMEEAKVVAIVKDDRQIEELKEGEEGLIILNETPFYAESGGQVGDSGMIVSSEATFDVRDCFSPISGLILHKGKVERGTLKIGDEVTAQVDAERRDATRRNHTATHLVHAALKEVLGSHVKQAGSVVAPNYLRFDFTHYQSLSDAEIQEIEDLVNRYILQNEPVNTNVMAIEEAMKTGAVALFGEKYGSDVRVLSVGEGIFSKELCGGTHVRATGDIGAFKITSDEAIASGVRRIRAITGFDAFERFREDEKLIEKSLGVLRTQRDNLPNAIEKLQEELKRTRREVEDLKMKIATGAVGGASSNGDEAKEINGVRVVAKIVEGLDKGGMRHLSDTLLARLKSGVVVLARAEEDKVSFIVRVSDDLTDKVKAGKIVQEIAPIVGGRGGGKPDMAEGGGTDASKLNDALQASYGVVEQMLS
jgi:alanyl-tRNA synthetase